MKILSPSDKFQPRGVGDLMHPGCCLACRSGNDSTYVDLGTYFDYEGQMYLCSSCLQEAAEVLGCLTIAESKHLQQTNELLATQASALKEQLDAANERLSAVDAVLRPLIVNDERSERPDLQTVPGSTGTVTELAGRRTSGESETTESGTSAESNGTPTIKPGDGFSI